MKGLNSFDENGYWNRYSNDNWSVRKVYDDVLGYEYSLSGERFNALEVVDKLASLEAENASLRERTRWRIVANGELPKKYEKVFILFRGDKPEVDYIDATGDWYFNNAPNVTHWMPKPSAPKEDE